MGTLALPAPRVLLLGERDGGLALWYALRGCEVWCTDRTGPTSQARSLHERYGVASRVTYHAVDIFDIPFPDAHFDVVGCKSVIGGLKREYGDRRTRTLQNQADAVAQMHRVLRPGGLMLGAENLRGTPLHHALRLLVSRGNPGWRHLALEELHELLRRFTRHEVETFGVLGSRVGPPAFRRLTAAVDTALRPVLPAAWCYVGCYRAWK